jgi:hypothetical protein
MQVVLQNADAMWSALSADNIQYTRRQWNIPIQASNFQSWDLSVGPLKTEIRGFAVKDCPQ